MLPDVIEEHLEEIAFLSIQRRKLLFAPDVTLAQLRTHEERIEAHRDGLAVGGPASVDVAIKHLDGSEAWEVHAAAQTWIELANPSSDVLIARIAATPPELLPAWREALRRLPSECVKRSIPTEVTLLEECLPSLQAIIIDAWGWHGILPAALLLSLSKSDDEGIRCALARAMGLELIFSPEDAQILDLFLSDPSVNVRRIALWSATLRNSHDPVSRIKSLASGENPDPFTLRILGLVGKAADMDILLKHVKQPETGTAALRALGDLGNPMAGNLLIEMMGSDDPEAALAAREAVQTLAGNLPSSETKGPPSPGDFEPSLEDVSSARAVWKELEATFRGHGVCLRGKPFPPAGELEGLPMETLWRLSILGRSPELAWLRREVPDGFFTAAASIEAIPGE